MNATKISNTVIFVLFFIGFVLLLDACKTKKSTVKTKTPTTTDTTEKCRLDIKSTKHLIEKMQQHTFNYEWIYARAETKLVIDSEDTDVDIKIRSKKEQKKQ